ncbi:MAG: hypothetical protein RQ751_04200 [Longimicrobiales bacterium]|nr:hypothetical protein [Longimicrobiales bacterium]
MESPDRTLPSSRSFPTSASDSLWRVAQGAGLVATLGLLAGLVLSPQATLRILWYGIIPVLPAVFLIHPGIWRNVCPLATLEILPQRRAGGVRLERDGARRALVVGLVLLAVLVPARRLLFNSDGPWLAGVIVGVALLALLLGLGSHRKARFCNALCPVLPVEKLYGQSPLLSVPNPRCAPCTACTASGCLDLVPTRAALEMADPGDRGGSRWLLTPFGIFAAAFPGFVVAYYLLGDVPASAWATVYGGVAAGSVASFALVGVVLAPARVPARTALPWLGLLAFLLYYWFGAPGVADAWSTGTAPTGVTVGIRSAALALGLAWTARRLRGAAAPTARAARR